jgi:hypothetical protein
MTSTPPNHEEISAEERVCRWCGERKPLSEFHRQRNGWQVRCKQCSWEKYGRDQNAARRDPSYRRGRNEYNKARRDLPQNRERERRHADRYRERYPEKESAKRAVARALRSGELVRPDKCQRCGVERPKGLDGRALIQAHHEDYGRPLDVQWLCVKCHAKAHRALIDQTEKEG